MKKFGFLILLVLFMASCRTVQNVYTPINDLNNAIANAKSGAVIKLEKKIYQVDFIVEIKGKKKLVIDGNGAKIVMNSLDSDVIFIDDSEQITLRNIRATHVEPSGPLGCTGNVIHIENSSNVLIEGSELNGSGIVGVAAYNTDNLKIVNNHIHKNSEYAIIYTGPSISITGNTFENNGNGNSIWYSYAAKGADSPWPPQHKIQSNETKQGLVMNGNVFK